MIRIRLKNFTESAPECTSKIFLQKMLSAGDIFSLLHSHFLLFRSQPLSYPYVYTNFSWFKRSNNLTLEYENHLILSIDLHDFIEKYSLQKMGS